jgi:phosphatidylglycerol lysyltransferase
MALALADDRIVAFANLWLTANRAEASVDLMRHRGDAPAGSMDYLFVHILQWAKDAGYRRFSLGIAPLSGIAGRRLAPAWARAAALVFNHGERFYGFRGLRAYKEKFDPDWEPRYIAGPGGIALVQALRDLSLLIGRTPPPSPLPMRQDDEKVSLGPAAA